MAADSTVGGINTSKADTYVSPSKKKKSENDLDKDAFLQLLVTQMQYQDPLNPGDSTEYMSQLAQYSSLEATMNISNTLEMGNSLNLVGEYVIMNTTDAAGNRQMISGLVQYATVKDGEVLLSINDTYYPASDLDSVVDYDYYLYLQGIAGGDGSENDKTDGTDDKNNGAGGDNNGNDKTEGA